MLVYLCILLYNNTKEVYAMSFVDFIVNVSVLSKYTLVISDVIKLLCK